jgi:hypothetical protein
MRRPLRETKVDGSLPTWIHDLLRALRAFFRPPRLAYGEGWLAEQDASSGWKGKAIEQLVAAHCVLGSGGELNVSTPMVDDAGVDLVFSRRNHPATLAVQVKARFSTSKRAVKGGFRIQVRRATFQPRSDLAILGVLYDNFEQHDILTAWLIPALEFHELTKSQSPDRAVLVMAAALKGKTNHWLKYRCDRKQLPGRVMGLLKQLGADQSFGPFAESV